ncbi:MAG TPA: redoxin domain-containing protein [Blastocatellia bacterium]|nr:redoxin domain-containing protein [Blastocatellia bacterium]
MRALLGRRGGRLRPLMLFLFYTACQPCVERLQDVQRIYDELGSKGLDVVIVSIRPMDDDAKLADCLRASRIHLPVFILSELTDDMAEEFFLPDWEAVVPSVFVYDRAGHLVTSTTETKNINYDRLHSQALKVLR